MYCFFLIDTQTSPTPLNSFACAVFCVRRLEGTSTGLYDVGAEGGTCFVHFFVLQAKSSVEQP